MLLALVLAWSGLTLITAAPATASTATDESQFLTKLNQERVLRGLPALVSDSKLAPTSRSWSANMGSQNRLYHDPNLAAVAASVEPNWRGVGENVGVGYGVQSLHDAFMGSPGHRANVLSSKFNRVGIGVAYANGKTWVTVRFLQGPAIAGSTGLGPPPPPPGVRSILTGDFDGDQHDDVLTYGPGSAPDELWFGRSDGRLRKVSTTINGHYRPLAGDFDGDGKTEIIWYAPGGTQDYIWEWQDGGGWSSTPTTINGSYAPVVGNFDGDRTDDILWYAPGSAGDYYWYGNTSGGFSSVATTINGWYRPIIGDLDGNGGDDIFWYAPGGSADWIWYSVKQRGAYGNTATTVNGHYNAFAGNVNGDATDDIFWYAPGSAGDFLWFMSTTRGRYSSVARTVNGQYLPAAADINGDGADDIVWFSPSYLSGDPIWFGQHNSTGYVNSSVQAG
ncbi:MAG: FG-GAP-like repeat-containing protein [Acidimicrobiales bacterium]